MRQIKERVVMIGVMAAAAALMADIILADRHVTVTLNGRRVIDNQPLDGCTGGALSSDDEAPGPIYFQGDHTAVEYRNIMLSPRIR